MKGIKVNIEKATQENTDFRHVLYTSSHSQLVLMHLQPGEDIGQEVHEANDQFFRFESGIGKCIVDGHEYVVKSGDAVLVPAGAIHNIINLDDASSLKFYTVYAPAHHKDGIRRKTKKDAETFEAPFDGATSEQPFYS